MYLLVLPCSSEFKHWCTGLWNARVFSLEGATASKHPVPHLTYGPGASFQRLKVVTPCDQFTVNTLSHTVERVKREHWEQVI